MFYPVKIEYVGPNERTLDEFVRNCVHTDCVVIRSEPGITNSSREPRSKGWLGTTNDISETALGAYETLEQAQEVARGEGGPIARGTGFPDPFHDHFYDDATVEVWPAWDIEAEWREADDWFADDIDDDAGRLAKGEVDLDDLENEYRDKAEDAGIRLWNLRGLLRQVERKAERLDEEDA